MQIVGLERQKHALNMAKRALHKTEEGRSEGGNSDNDKSVETQYTMDEEMSLPSPEAEASTAST
jgi:hypothetical protein